MSFPYLRQVDTYLSEKKVGGVFLQYLNEKKNFTYNCNVFFIIRD